MGNRPAELSALLASLTRQTSPPDRVVVVGQGTRLKALPPGVEGIELPVNLGLPAGRNVALARLRAHGDVDVVMYLDDDGLLPDRWTAQKVRDAFATDTDLGIISFRIADEQGVTQRRHVPRLRAHDPLRASRVTTFLGGGNAVRMAVSEQVGDWPAEFFWAHEETDVAWRALDAGWRIDYRPDILLQHPRTSPARHQLYYRMNARNRVWLARRHLPGLLVPIYLTVWVLVTVVRRPPFAGLRAWAGGFVEGWRRPCGGRRPIRWRTVWRMTLLGRPPIV
ncbi:Glycosyltransferase, GT2 family [Actinopolymorpha cephalotaxi]|uniref:GT2 family glycosyltransferase n=1 Tax=Actinopolymorpha cephalotaxi TaxID=504797 RepID=A0A1I2NBC3_9ACTN|nr:glycosyltransferase [Actinopolymorpha cephalotaxi]NYH85598.1 GT2 family glycosyltransferase [Actinopolymorpha cephalotaxi]SFG01164.1 Glycosyltransferase, GT2 family [Actinopolymorpha cephalotaxi]